MIHNYYWKLKGFLDIVSIDLTAYFRRVLRFLALPYCYFSLINWQQCTASRYQVLRDLLYVFFTLKYFPDNYSQCRLWEKGRTEWPFYYGSMYDPYQRGRLRREVQRSEYLIVFEDKEICYLVCKALGLPLPKLHCCIDQKDNFVRIISGLFEEDPNRKLIIKPIRGKGGKGVITAFIENGDAVVSMGSKKYPLAAISLYSRALVQEFVPQHRDMARIHEYSVNTIRIQTLLTRDDEVVFLGAMARFGRHRSSVDNLSSGGMGVGIDMEKGELKELAHDFNSETHLFHPDSNIRFKGYKIPLWQQVLDLSKKIQSSFASYRLLGLDIAISPTGPIIIEINAEPDNVMMEQCYGPILLDKTIRKEFSRYDLLINRPSRVSS